MTQAPTGSVLDVYVRRRPDIVAMATLAIAAVLLIVDSGWSNLTGRILSWTAFFLACTYRGDEVQASARKRRYFILAAALTLSVTATFVRD